MQRKPGKKKFLSAIKIRKASRADCMDLFLWRNDPVTRRNSILNTNEVPLEEHEQWFAGKLKSPKSRLYIGVADKSKIGVMRFEIEKDRVVVSINVNPLYRRMGVGTKLTGLTTRKIFKETGKPIVAEIRNNNINSIKMFSKNKYAIKKKTKDITYMCFTGKELSR